MSFTKKIISICILIIVVLFLLFLINKTPTPQLEPDSKISLQLNEIFISSLLNIDKQGNIYTGVLKDYPQLFLRIYDREGNFNNEFLLRDENGYLVARQAGVTGKTVISRGYRNQGWQGIMEIDKNQNIILIDPAEREIVILNQRGFLQKHFPIEIVKQQGIEHLSIIETHVRENFLYLLIQPSEQVNDLITIKINLEDKSSSLTDGNFGPVDNTGNIYFSKYNPGWIFTRKNVIFNIKNPESGEIVNKYELPLSWSFQEWSLGLLDFHPHSQKIFFLEWKSPLGRKLENPVIKKYNLVDKEKTGFTELTTRNININSTQLKIKNNRLYLFLNNHIKIYDL